MPSKTRISQLNILCGNLAYSWPISFPHKPYSIFNSSLWLCLSIHLVCLSFFILAAASFAQAVEQNTTHWLSVPGVESRHFCLLHLGINVTKKNTAQSSTGWNDALLTHRRDRARSASTVGVSPQWPAVLSQPANAGQFTYMHSSHATVEETPSHLPQKIDIAEGLARCHKMHNL